MDTSTITNRAYLTYLDQEEKLLEKYEGKYVWIEGEEIREISSDCIDLLHKAEREGCDPEHTIIRKIRKEPDVAFMS